MSSVRCGTAYNMVGLLLVERIWHLVVPGRNVFATVAHGSAHPTLIRAVPGAYRRSVP